MTSAGGIDPSAGVAGGPLGVGQLGVGPMGSRRAVDGPPRGSFDAAEVAHRATRLLADVVTLQIELDRCETVDAALGRAAGALLDILAGRIVAIVMIASPDELTSPHLAWATRGTAGDEIRVGADANQADLIAAAMEIVRREEPIRVPAVAATDRYQHLAVAGLIKSRAAVTVHGYPLVAPAGVICGAIVIIDHDADATKVSIANVIEAFQSPLASRLMAIGRSTPTALQRRVGSVTAWLVGGRRWIAVVATVCVIVLSIPVPYHIACTCTIQPAGRRFIVAPIDAPLESSAVQPGDVVAAGDVLATLSSRDIDMQLAGVRAQVDRSIKEADGHLAGERYAENQIAELETQRLQLEADLLNHHREDLRLRSPIDGIVLAGDFRNSRGAPLSRGQTMLELAPLGVMHLETAIPQTEIAWADRDADVQFRLHAYPDRQWTVKVQRIEPVAQVIDQKNVFVARSQIRDAEHLLRPGMQGRGWLRAGTAPIGWVLFHRPLATLRVWLGW